MSSAWVSSFIFASFIMFLISSRRPALEWWRWGGTNSGTNHPERSAFLSSEVVRRFLGHTTSDLRFRYFLGRSVE